MTSHRLASVRALLRSLDLAETDGCASHGTRVAFQRDRRRDQLLLRAGYRWVRFSWRDVVDDSDWVVETVRRGLAGA